MGDMVLETNMTEILTRIEDQNKLEKRGIALVYFLQHYFVVFFVYRSNTKYMLSSFY